MIHFKASSDWVVAIFPAFFETLHRQFGLTFWGLDEIGSAGFNGFERSSSRQEVHYGRGAHDCALSPDNFPAIADYVFSGENTFDRGTNGAAKKNFWVTLAWQMCWLIWIALAALLFACGAGFTHLLAWLTPVKNRLVWAGVYVFVVYCFLYTF